MTATTETLGQTTEPGRPSPWLRFGAAFAIGLAAALLIGAGALYAYDRLYVGRILPGVHVGPVDLSGLTPEAARAELQREYGSLAQGRVVLTGIQDEQVALDHDGPRQRHPLRLTAREGTYVGVEKRLHTQPIKHRFGFPHLRPLDRRNDVAHGPGRQYALLIKHRDPDPPAARH